MLTMNHIHALNDLLMVQGEQLLAAQKIVTSVYYLQRKKSYYEPICNKYVGALYNRLRYALSGQVSRYIVKSLKSSI